MQIPPPLHYIEHSSMQQPSPQLLSEITAKLLAIESADAASSGPHWGAMHKLLLKAKVGGASLLPIVGTRDLAELKNVIATLRGEEVVPIIKEPAPVIAEIDPSILQSALKMYRRRMKFSRLDRESTLGVGPMSGGANHRIESMIPPKEFPLAVWDALVLAGKLRREGQGFYSLIDDGTEVQW